MDAGICYSPYIPMVYCSARQTGKTIMSHFYKIWYIEQGEKEKDWKSIPNPYKGMFIK